MYPTNQYEKMRAKIVDMASRSTGLNRAELSAATGLAEDTAAKYLTMAAMRGLVHQVKFSRMTIRYFVELADGDAWLADLRKFSADLSKPAADPAPPRQRIANGAFEVAQPRTFRTSSEPFQHREPPRRAGSMDFAKCPSRISETEVSYAYAERAQQASQHPDAGDAR